MRRKWACPASLCNALPAAKTWQRILVWWWFYINHNCISTVLTENDPRTMVQNRQEYRLKYWVTRLFACSGLLTSLTPSAALTRSLTRSLRSWTRSWESEFLMSQNDLVLSHKARGHIRCLLFYNCLFHSSCLVASKTLPKFNLNKNKKIIQFNFF